MHRRIGRHRRTEQTLVHEGRGWSRSSKPWPPGWDRRIGQIPLVDRICRLQEAQEVGCAREAAFVGQPFVDVRLGDASGKRQLPAGRESRLSDQVAKEGLHRSFLRMGKFLSHGSGVNQRSPSSTIANILSVFLLGTTVRIVANRTTVWKGGRSR